MSIKQVKKRDGEFEAYTPNKILKWLFWGSKSLEAVIDWQKIMLKVDSELFDGISTQQIQLKIIDYCLAKQDTRYNLLAGRLYTAFLRKKLFDDKLPSVREQFEKCAQLGYMEKLDYSDEEWAEIETIIEHDRDFNLHHSQVSQLYSKYSLFNQKTNERYETPQYTCMRMALALSKNESNRMTAVRENYDMFSRNEGNAPTPNYLNLGTEHRGLLSCCLYKADDRVTSIDVGDHIAYTMTYMSAGVGGILAVRSLDDPVKGGKIKHKGKLPYYRRQAASVGANSQGGRGGSCTSYFTCFDPEVMTLIHLQNPRTSKLKQIREIHFAIQFNAFFYEKVMKKEEVFLFNVYTAPDLYQAFYDPDSENFAKLYAKYEADPSFKKTYLNAAVIAVAAGRQFHEVSTLYRMNVTAANAHTPFKEPIETSNLCVEIMQPTKAYGHITELYDPEDTPDKGEISLCGLGAIVPSRIIQIPGEEKMVRPSLTMTLASDIKYEQVAYRQLRMIDQCLHLNHYVFPHLKTTALNRMNAGVGIMGVAYEMAKRNLRYDSEEGLKYIHFLAERHSFFLIKAALQLGKEHGNAPWMHKTKWPDGWLPIDTYNKNVDKIADFKLYYPWEELRSAVIENGGIRFSCVVAHQPQESCLDSKTEIQTVNGPMSLKDIFELSGVTLDQAAINREPILGGDWYDLKEPVQVKTRFGDKTVTRAWYNGQTPYAKITLENGEVINATLGHKFLVRREGREEWVEVALLREDDDIVSVAEVRIKKIEIIDAGNQHFIDIEVPDVHEYILASGIVSHNSSKACNLPNSYYPIRDLKVMKSDESNLIEFIAPEAETLGKNYQLCWEVGKKDMTKVIAVWQKFGDSGISGDSYSDRTDNAPLKASSLLDEIIYDHLYGVKSRYYTVSKTTKGKNIAASSSVPIPTTQVEIEDDMDLGIVSLEEACPGGFCSL